MRLSHAKHWERSTADAVTSSFTGQPAPGREEAARDAHELEKHTASGRDTHADPHTRVPAVIMLSQGQNSDGLIIAKHTHNPYSPAGCKGSTAASVQTARMLPLPRTQRRGEYPKPQPPSWDCAWFCGGDA